MSYLLDSNTCILYLNGRSGPVRRRLESQRPEELVVCSVVRAELFFGTLRTQNPAHMLVVLNHFLKRFPSLPFDDQCVEAYGRVRAHLASNGTPIGPNDLFIAAIALTHEAILVTHNTREFARVQGLAWEDWDTGERSA